MRTRGFHQVDVFGSGPYRGNPVAVVADADGLTDGEMATISEWTNLSECTFLVPPSTAEADYRVRIFSLREELPFAGHPTLGTARAWLAAGGVPRSSGLVVQECAAGLVPIRRDGDLLAFAAPPLVRDGGVDGADLTAIAGTLGIGLDEIVASQWVDNGPGWVALMLRDADAVLAVRPGAPTAEGPTFIGVAGPASAGTHDWEVRGFFPDGTGTLREDPVTGSLNASLAQWLLASGRASAPYTARQGTALGREGHVRIAQDAAMGDAAMGTVWVGGATHVAIHGTIEA